MKTKLLFLDIDGVLNWAKTEDRLDGYVGLCKDRIARFNRIIEAVPDVKIVVSSTWRHMHTPSHPDFPGLVKLLQARGLKGTIIGHTLVRMSPQARGHEIRTYLERFKRGEEGAGILDTFVILDDDEAGMRGYSGGMDLCGNHVVTTWDGREVGAGAYDDFANYRFVEGGLQDEHVELAIAVLKGERAVPYPFYGSNNEERE